MSVDALFAARRSRTRTDLFAASGNCHPGRIYGDLARNESIAAMPTIDTIIHLAQSHQYRNFPAAAADIFAVNTMATYTSLISPVVRACNSYPGFDRQRMFCHEEARLQPDNFYAATKLAAELYCLSTRAICERVRCACSRNRPIPMSLQRVRESQPVTLDGDGGGLQLSVTYVDDVAATFTAAAEQGWQGTYNVAATEPTCVQ